MLTSIRSCSIIAVFASFLFSVPTVEAQCPAGTFGIPQLSVRNSSDVIVQNACQNPSDGTIMFLAPKLAGAAGNSPTQISNPSPTDGFIWVEPSNCWMKAATTAFTTGPVLSILATGSMVLTGTTNTTAGTIEVTCDLTAQSRTTVGKGLTISSVDLYYGVQTTALASIAAAQVSSVTFPAAGAAAAGTVAALGGTLTVTPGTLQLATTTSGQCYHENVSFGTAYAYNSGVVKVSLDQVFTTAGTTATTLQICGVAVNYTNTPL